MKAVVLDAGSISPEVSWAPIEKQTESLQIHSKTPRDQVVRHIEGHDIVIVNKVILDKDVLQACADLKLICLLATGSNNIDLQTAKARGIAVANARSYCNDSVAQHVMGLILCLARNLGNYNQSVYAGRWQKSEHFCYFDFPITELNGKELLLIGNGQLSQAVSKLASAFGMTISATDSKTPTAHLRQLISKADIISLHCPLTENTKGMVNHDFLRRMKSSAFLINTARGPIVDEQALYVALEQRHIAGAALDVLSEEPPSLSHPLLKAKFSNLILTPHIAWGGTHAQARVIQEVADNISFFRQGKQRNRI